jgi:2-deoxy-D-gluconate 3-dehydrogenase
MRAASVRRRVEAHGRTFAAYRADLGSETGAKELASALLADGLEVDILVNNAGTIARAPALDHRDEQWQRVLQTNLTSPFMLARELGRPMVERSRGKIIFIASMLSFQGGLNVVSYTAAKSGVAGLVRALANEWAPHGVNVNAIAPGYIATDNTQPLRDDPERSRAILERIPAGRWGEPADVAGATVFLASAASDFVHGVILPVDGGWLGR